MVDEFQDTNRLQLALIAALQRARDDPVRRRRRAAVDLRLPPRRPRRSSAASASGSGSATGAEVLPLSGNFRARPELIAATNAIGEELLGGLQPGGFPPLTVGKLPDGGGAARRRPGGRAAAHRGGRLGRGGDRARPPGRRPDAAPRSSPRPAALAARLRELAAEGVPRGDIVVLLRAFTHVDAFEEALDRAGLSPYVVGGRGYWSQQQVEDLLCLLSVVANPLDDQPLLGALASPAGGVGPDTLWLLRRATGGASDRSGRRSSAAVGAWEAELDGPGAARADRSRAARAPAPPSTPTSTRCARRAAARARGAGRPRRARSPATTWRSSSSASASSGWRTSAS